VLKAIFPLAASRTERRALRPGYLANLCPFQCHVLEGVRRVADTFLSHHKRPKARPTLSACQNCSTRSRSTTVRSLSNEKKNDFSLGAPGAIRLDYWPVYLVISVVCDWRLLAAYSEQAITMQGVRWSRRKIIGHLVGSVPKHDPGRLSGRSCRLPWPLAITRRIGIPEPNPGIRGCGRGRRSPAAPASATRPGRQSAQGACRATGNRRGQRPADWQRRFRPARRRSRAPLRGSVPLRPNLAPGQRCRLLIGHP
jgi:hypothetical protein